MPDVEEILPYVNDKLVSMQTHPEDSNVLIFNYTEKCQFDRKWDEVTTKCRGLIIDSATGKHLSNPFPKFFNYDEHLNLGLSLPTTIPVVTEKYDGSLGILYWLNDVPYIATRGSFTSDQAIWATEWIRKQDLSKLSKQFSYLFEIIYPANRIVVNYNFSGLVFLSARPLTETVTETFEMNVSHAKVYPFDSIEKLKGETSDNREGYVLYYQNEDVRVKIKFDEYVRLHKLLTGMSEKTIWEMLKAHGIDTKTDELVKDVPDEFYKWVSDVVEKLKSEYQHIENSVKLSVDNAPTSSRKDIALFFLSQKYSSVCFSMYDKKEYSELIFKLIQPSI